MTQASIQDQLIQTLKENNFKQWADQIEALIQLIEQGSNQDKVAAARDIQGLCTMRSLGDLNITTISGWEWNTLLEKFNNDIQKKVKDLAPQ